MNNETLMDLIDAWFEQNSINKNVQRRIYSYGIKSGESSVLARLCRVKNIDKDIDGLLKECDYADVRAAWCVSRKRSSGELIDLLTNEKRGKVILSVLERGDLSDKVVNLLVSNITGKKNLLKVIDSHTYSKRSRLAAGRRLLSTYVNELSDVKKLWFDSEYVMRLLSPLNVRALDLSDNPVVISSSTSDYCFTDDEMDIILKYYLSGRDCCNNFSKGERDVLAVVFDRLFENGVFLEKYAVNCLSKLNLIHQSCDKDGRACSEIIKLIDSLNDITSSGLVDAYHVLANGSKSAVNKRVRSLERLFNNGYTVSQSMSSKLGIAVMANENCDVKDVERVSDWFSYHYSDKAIKEVKDPKKVAYYLYHYYYSDGDKVLNKLSNRDSVLKELIEICREEGQVPDFLSDLSWFSTECALKLPLNVFFSSVFNKNLVKGLLSEVEKVCVDDSSWEAFVTLSDEFEGSGSELLNACRNL
ncbi:MAG: hypothetical protein ACKOW9_00645 [Candidatus Paceibacterota bacterium]